MIKLDPEPYIDNALEYWRKNIPPSPESYTESEWDRDFTNWLCPIYKCRIKVRKKDGRIRWFEFDNERDLFLFTLRWS
jgi:hypothetical protein